MIATRDNIMMIMMIMMIGLMMTDDEGRVDDNEESCRRHLKDV